MEFGAVDHIKIYYLMRALASSENLQDELTKSLVNYVIKRGYDADDLLMMNDDKKNLRRAVHFVMLIAYSNPDLKNKHLNNMLTVFTREAISSGNLNHMQAFELFKALRHLKNFKGDNLLKSLKKQAFGNLIADGYSEE